MKMLDRDLKFGNSNSDIGRVRVYRGEGYGLVKYMGVFRSRVGVIPYSPIHVIVTLADSMFSCFV
jgi:hypothetical protein